jgi:hypothetical protein
MNVIGRLGHLTIPTSTPKVHDPLLYPILIDQIEGISVLFVAFEPMIRFQL